MKAVIVFVPPILWIMAWLMFGFNSQESSSVKTPTYHEQRNRVPFTLVCSKSGRFNYVTDGGYIFPLYDFATLEEATKARDEMKAYAERTKREERVWTPEERAKQEAVQSTRWEHCEAPSVPNGSENQPVAPGKPK